MLPEFQGERVIPGEAMVMVEQVIDRPTKDDCRNYTKVLWLGKGDVQPYPKRLWPKLALHPDVWRLADDQTLPFYLQPPKPTLAAVQASAPAVARPATLTINGLPLLTGEQLAALNDEEVRQAASDRKLGLHAKLGSDKIRGEVMRLQLDKLANPKQD